MSPADSTNAARQSLNPAPVRSRNSFTRFAGICIADGCVLILILSDLNLFAAPASPLRNIAKCNR
jgi:hypothetical protein